MNWIEKVKVWINRQAHQPSTWIGSSLATFVLFWPFIAPSMPRIIDSLQDDNPYKGIALRVIVGLFGLICTIYNEDAGKPGN